MPVDLSALRTVALLAAGEEWNRPAVLLRECAAELAALRAEVKKLGAEKQEMVNRNELLRKRLDLDPAAIVPRLKILDEIDRLRAHNTALAAALRELDGCACYDPCRDCMVKINAVLAEHAPKD